VTTRPRRAGPIDELDERPDPSIDALVAASQPAGATLWLVGGEPTLRADLPDLIAALTRAGHTVGLATDALALVDDIAVRPLVEAGLTRVRVTLHAARADAHDWLVSLPGAARRALRAIDTLRRLALAIELAATVTRPTVPYLGELASLAAKAGAEALWLRRLELVGRAASEAIMLAPRFALAERHLEEAVRIAERRGVRVVLEGFPECAVGEARHARALPAQIESIGYGAAAGEGCARCPGMPSCAGVPADYAARFGLDEFRERATTTSSVDVVRFRFEAPSRVSCAACGDNGGDAAPETTRRARLRLVRAAQHGAQTLRIASASSLAHPAAAALLREAALLGFRRVEVAGDVSALAAIADSELYPLRGITRLDAALYGPDAASHDTHAGRPGAFGASFEALDRFARLTGAETGVFAVLHDDTAVPAWARAFETLPFDPCFRLSHAGGSLDALAEQARALTGNTGEALTALLPPCLVDQEGLFPLPRKGEGWGGVDAFDPTAPPSGSDRYGIFTPCVCGPEQAQRCPGLAVGWQCSLLP
jgi:hypothetical protein